MANINPLVIPYPDFKLNETIDPEQFDTNNNDIKNKVNEIVAKANDVYTKSEIDAPTRNHLGTWQGYNPTQVGDAVTSQRMTNIETDVTKLKEKVPATAITLKRGQQLITNANDIKSPFAVLNLRGRTLVNLLGRSGGLELTGKNGLTRVSESLDSTNYIIGQNGIKVTATGTTTDDHYSTLSHSAVLNDKFVIGANKYYVLIGALKPNVGQAEIRSVVSDSSNTVITVTDSISTDTTKLVKVFQKIPSGVSGVKLEVRLQLLTSTGATAFIPSGTPENATFDGIRVYEVDLTTYNKISDGVTAGYQTADDLDKLFPYMDDVKHITNPYIVKQGKNHLPPFTEWTLDATADVTEPYKLTQIATAVNQRSQVDIKVIPNQPYTLSFTGQTANSNIYVAGFNTPVNGVLNFTPTTDTITVKTENLVAGTFTFDKPMLNLGNVALPHEPQNQDVLYVPTSLASSVDGTVYDTLYERDGALRKLKRFHTMDLDGSLAWLYDQDKAGYKNVYCNAVPPHLDGSETVVKHDGKILKSIRPSTDTATFLAASEQSLLNAAINITVTDTDSGWGETYAPTADEIKAYFNGWVMYNNAAGGAPNNPANNTYNGTGTKAWAYRNADGTTYGGGTTVLPALLAPNFKPYKFTYQLATEVEETVLGETGLALHDGLNQVELGEGLIVREVANPYVGSDGVVRINSKWDGSGTAGASSFLKYRTDKILRIYKNGQPDPLWRIFSGDVNTNGKQSLDMSKSNFDPTAEYTVTYLALDKHSVSGNVGDVSAQYTTNLKTVVDDVVQRQADTKRQVDALGITLDMMRTKVNEEPWIAPTLLNGWVLYGDSLNAVIGYYKDASGMIHIQGVVKSGTTAVGTSIFVLPPGFRPRFAKRFAMLTNNGSIVPAGVLIMPNGNVQIETSMGNTWIDFGEIEFRAEQ